MTARSVNVAVKAGFAALLLFVAVRHDLPQFQGKALPLRLGTYPIAALLVPLVWARIGRPTPYPHDVDALLAAPFAIDLAGNALDLFDSVTWWDDANHFVNWALLVAAAGRLLRPTPDPDPAPHGDRSGHRLRGRDRDAVGVRRVPDVRPALGGAVHGVSGHDGR